MNASSSKPTSLIPTVILAFVALLMLPAAISAQRSAPTGVAGPSPGGGVREGPRPPSIRERQFKINEMEREAAKPRTPFEERLALSQIAEDFEQIQIINNKMMGATMRAAAPDYARIADVTAEVKRRARRLRDNLRLGEVEDTEEAKESKSKKTVEPGKTKANLLALDESIMSFIKNPIFQSPKVVNLAQATKARHDIDEIIQLSELIKKDAERLSKTSEKTSAKPD